MFTLALFSQLGCCEAAARRAICSAAVYFFLKIHCIFNDFYKTNYHLTSAKFSGLMEHVDNQSLKVVFPFLKGRCHGNQFLLALSTELSVDEIWQVVSNATDSLDASKPITTTKLIKLTSDPAGRVNVSLSPASILCVKNKAL